jgi:hypothetical protein
VERDLSADRRRGPCVIEDNYRMQVTLILRVARVEYKYPLSVIRLFLEGSSAPSRQKGTKST